MQPARKHHRVWIKTGETRREARPEDRASRWACGSYTLEWDTAFGGREDIVFEHHPGLHERLLPSGFQLAAGGPVNPAGVEAQLFCGLAGLMREIADDIWRGRLCPSLFNPDLFAPRFSGHKGRRPSVIMTIGWFGFEPGDPRYEAHVGRYLPESQSVRVLIEGNDRRFEALNRQVLRHEVAHFALHSAFPFAHHRETSPGGARRAPKFRFWDWLVGRFEDLRWLDNAGLSAEARESRLARILRDIAGGVESVPKDSERLLGFALFDRVRAEMGLDRHTTARGVLTDAYHTYNRLSRDGGGVEVAARLSALFGLDGLFPEDLSFFGAAAAEGSSIEKLHRFSVLLCLSRGLERRERAAEDYVERLRGLRHVRLLPDERPGSRALCLPTRYTRDWRARLPADEAGSAHLVGLLHQLRTMVGAGLATPGDFERFIDPMEKAWAKRTPREDASELWGRFLLWWCSSIRRDESRQFEGFFRAASTGEPRVTRSNFIGVQMWGPEGLDAATPEVWQRSAERVEVLVGAGFAPRWRTVDNLDEASRTLHGARATRERRQPTTLVLGEGFDWDDTHAVGTLASLVREYWVEDILAHHPLAASAEGDEGRFRPAPGWWSARSMSRAQRGLLGEPWCDARGRVMAWTHPPFIEWTQGKRVFGEVYYPEGDRFSNQEIVQASQPMMRLLRAVRFHRELLV